MEASQWQHRNDSTQMMPRAIGYAGPLIDGATSGNPGLKLRVFETIEPLVHPGQYLVSRVYQPTNGCSWYGHRQVSNTEHICKLLQGSCAIKILYAAGQQ